MDDTISASDFTSAEATISSEPAADTAPAVEASAPVDTPAQPEGATTEPAAEPTVDSPVSTEPDDRTPGPRLKDHLKVVENARIKAVAEYQQKYGWAEQVNPQEFQQIRQIAQHFSSGDVVGGLQAMIAEARKDPAVDAQIRSFAAKTLAQRQSPPEEQEPQPDLPIQLEDGRVVHLYSGQQQAKREAFLHKQWLQGVQQELQPLKQSHEAQQKVAEAARFEAAWGQWQAQTVADATTWPGMDNPAIRTQFAKEVEKSIMRPDVQSVEQIERAIDRAYRTVVVPSLQTTSRQAVLNDITRQANASTVNPAHTSTRAPKSMDEMSISEALRHVAAQNA